MAFQKLIGLANGDPRNATGNFRGKPLRDVAAFHLNRLNEAYKKRFGRDIGILEGMRSIATQQHYWNLYQQGRGNLAAWPGTSNHGWGVAVDLDSPLDNRYSTEHQWLVENAPNYGWWWAGRTFSQVEPWHFEFDGRNGNDTITQTVAPPVQIPLGEEMYLVRNEGNGRVFLVTAYGFRWVDKDTVSAVTKITGRGVQNVNAVEFTAFVYDLHDLLRGGPSLADDDYVKISDRIRK